MTTTIRTLTPITFVTSTQHDPNAIKFCGSAATAMVMDQQSAKYVVKMVGSPSTFTVRVMSYSDALSMDGRNLLQTGQRILRACTK